jgi:hypothetical protein
LLPLGFRRFAGVREEDHVVRPLPDELAILHGARPDAEYAEGLIAHLPPVAVGAMQEVSAPALTDTGNRRQLVDRSSCNE